MRLRPLQGNEVIQKIFGYKKAKRSNNVFHGVRHYTESLLLSVNISGVWEVKIRPAIPVHCRYQQMAVTFYRITFGEMGGEINFKVPQLHFLNCNVGF